VKSKRILRAVGSLVSYIYRRCDLILAQSRSLVPLIRRYSGADVEVAYFPNWVESAYGEAAAVAPAPEVAHLHDAFTVMYAGNIGEAQDFPAVLAAAARLKGHRRIRWLIVGEGRVRCGVEQEIERRGLGDRFLLLGRFPLDRMTSFFFHADALLVSLKRAPLFAMTVPGKLQTYLAAGIPVIGMLDGEGASIIREARAGFAGDAGDSASLAENVLAMSSLDGGEMKAMGLRGREYAAKEFDQEALMARLDGWLVRLSQPRRRPPGTGRRSEMRPSVVAGDHAYRLPPSARREPHSPSRVASPRSDAPLEQQGESVD
jgi:glycosyltransferase involved in cell wall biosynthesis